MKDQPIVSVIIPTHNSGKYIKQAIDSVLRQTLSNYEVLCVDSSSDETVHIIGQCVGSDERFRVIIDPNSSYGHKINRGINEAVGKYMAILESDDFYDDSMLELLVNYMEEYDLDFVKGVFYNYAEFNGKCFAVEQPRAKSGQLGGVYDLTNDVDAALAAVKNIWSGLYNLDFLGKNHIYLNESEGASYQDTGFSVLCALYGTRVMFAAESVYYYRRDNETSSVKQDSKYLCVRDEFKWIYHQVKKRMIYTETAKTLLQKLKLTTYVWNIERLSPRYRSLFRKAVYDELTQEFPASIRNVDYAAKIDELKYIPFILGETDTNEYRYLKEPDAQINEMFRWLCENNTVVIFGAGRVGKEILSYACYFPGKELVVVDNDKQKWGTDIYNHRVKAPETVFSTIKDARFVITSLRYSEDIRKQLVEKNIGEESIITLDHFLKKYEVFHYLLELSEG